MREDLLQPTLSGDDTRAAPPSTQAMFFTAFFGGPAAAVAIIAVASYRLQRVARDWPILLVLLLVPTALIVALLVSDSTADVRHWLTTNLGSSGMTIVNRALSLLCFAVGYGLHREAHRNSTLLGLKAPNGWLVGPPCVAFGYAFLFSVAMFANRAAGSTL